jgi:7,8-dihydropterin-6-yl-methyl-4-(beta-D-ribofuranosyl)aminobenzene 5'-phosphate synthase
MAFRISPLWWPLLAAASPVVIPLLFKKNRRYQANLAKVADSNRDRLEAAEALDLPALDFLELTVLVEEKSATGFYGDAGVSYLCRTNRGALLFDVGFGPERPALAHNAAQLDVSLDQVDALVISHLHPDHMGGLKASRTRQVTVPPELGPPRGQACFLPDQAEAEGFACERVDSPRLLPAGLATTGPLARSLFFMGWTEEQALVANVKDKGLVIITGCGHPTIELIVRMVRRISDQPIHAIAGGLHFPVTGGRGNRIGIQFQTLIGTGKPAWQRITDEDLTTTIAALNDVQPREVLLSGHDSCDPSLARLQQELDAASAILTAGKTYRI